MARIRAVSGRAAHARLEGRMQEATKLDRQIDALYNRAESRGWGDDAVQAEEDGRHRPRKRNPRRKRRNPKSSIGTFLLAATGVIAVLYIGKKLTQ